MSFPFHPHPVPCRNCGTILQATYAADFLYCCPGCGVEVCYACGCSEKNPCSLEISNLDHTAEAIYNCGWSEVGTCSFCFSRAAYEFYQEATGQPADDPYYMNLGRTVLAVKGLEFGV